MIVSFSVLVPQDGLVCPIYTSHLASTLSIDNVGLLVQIFKKTAKEYGMEKKGKILTKQGEQTHYKQCT
jgi:hypothetical protein